MTMLAAIRSLATLPTLLDGRRMQVHSSAQTGGLIGVRVRMQGTTDEELMVRVAKRDHDAFGQLVNRHMRRVLSLAQNVLGVAADADEIAQETFARLWTQPMSFDASRAQFTTWLHRVVVNQCIDRRRAHRFDPLDVVTEHPSPDPPVADLLHVEQQQIWMHAALQRLPMRQRTALALFHLQELSQREAAKAMELSDSAFESLLHRARRALAAAMLGKCAESEDCS